MRSPGVLVVLEWPWALVLGKGVGVWNSRRFGRRSFVARFSVDRIAVEALVPPSLTVQCSAFEDSVRMEWERERGP